MLVQILYRWYFIVYLRGCKICCLNMRRIYDNRYCGSLFRTLLTNYSSHIFNARENETSVRRYDKIFTAVNTLKQKYHIIKETA